MRRSNTAAHTPEPFLDCCPLDKLGAVDAIRRLLGQSGVAADQGMFRFRISFAGDLACTSRGQGSDTSSRWGRCRKDPLDDGHFGIGHEQLWINRVKRQELGHFCPLSRAINHGGCLATSKTRRYVQPTWLPRLLSPGTTRTRHRRTEASRNDDRSNHPSQRGHHGNNLAPRSHNRSVTFWEERKTGGRRWAGEATDHPAWRVALTGSPQRRRSQGLVRRAPESPSALCRTPQLAASGPQLLE